MKVEEIKELLDLHLQFREEYAQWFIWPDRIETVYFVFQEAGEVGDAIKLNSGDFARNRGGSHKATKNDLAKELADLFLMLHTLFYVICKEQDQSFINNDPVAHNISYEIKHLSSTWSLDNLAYEISTATLAASNWENKTPSRKSMSRDYVIRAMAYVASHPEFSRSAVVAVLEKWKARAIERKEAENDTNE